MLEGAISAAGGGIHRVVLPPQSLKDGSVTLRVVVFNVGKVTVKGAEFHDDDNVRRSLPALREGEPPDMPVLLGAIDLINRLPAKQVKLGFRASDVQADAVDVDVIVDDSKPVSLFGFLANTGTAGTGPLRLTVGAEHANLWNLDHVGSFSYTNAPGHAGLVKQWGLGYTLPMYPWQGSFSAYFIRSNVNTGTVFDVFDVSGRGDFAGIRYTQQLPRAGKLSHRASVGIDDKLFDNTILFGGVNLGQDSRSRPITLEYAGNYYGDGWLGDFYVSWVRNTASGGGNNKAAYAANRAGADPHFSLVRAGGSARVGIFGDWSLRGTVDSQYANEPLIPGEQFGAGGANSVRGFDEREIAADNGVTASVELWTPPLGDTPASALVFVDGARLTNKGAGAAQSRREGLLSVGVGMRLTVGEYVSVSADIAQVLNGVTGGENDAHGHIGVLVRY